MKSLENQVTKCTPQRIAIKGRSPQKQYSFTLADIYVKHCVRSYSLAEAESTLAPYAERFAGISVSFIQKLFPPEVDSEQRGFARLPVILGNAPVKKLEFNLHYQDTRIKLAIEDKLGLHCPCQQYEQEAQDLMETVAVLLNTESRHGQALWRELTDNDLDALMYMLLDCYDPSRRSNLLQAGYQTNDRALESLSRLKGLEQLSLEEFIHYQVFAGTVRWLDAEFDADLPLLQARNLAINDVDKFEREVSHTDTQLVFFFDDNGELVWDLILIQRLLDTYPTLQICGIINTRVIANNANLLTLNLCLNHSIFQRLRNSINFTTFAEDNFRSAIDLAYCSNGLINRIASADCALIKGASFFETIQCLPVNTYYGFVVYSYDSQICTGLAQRSGIFTRVPKGLQGYYYLQQTLQEIHPTFE